MGSYEDEVLYDVLPMDACHIVFGRPWYFDNDVIHRRRRTENDLKHKFKKIVLSPMSITKVGSMLSKKSIKPNLAILVNNGKDGKVID